MKGLTITLSVLIIFGITLSLSFLFASRSLEFSRALDKNLVSDRVYYKFDSISSDLLRIVRQIYGLNVSVEENDFTIVTFQEELPKSWSEYFDFLSALTLFKSFSETYTETNLVTSVNTTDLIAKMPLVVLPYNISYEHKNIVETLSWSWGNLGDEYLKITPINVNLLKSYDISLRLVGEKKKDITTSLTGECEVGNLRWNITTVADDGSITNITYIDPEEDCSFIVYRGTGKFVNFTNNENIPGELIVRIKVLKPIFNISLNLTDIPGKTEVSLPPQIIQIKETLYQIEKNDTAYFY